MPPDITSWKKADRKKTIICDVTFPNPELSKGL